MHSKHTSYYIKHQQFFVYECLTQIIFLVVKKVILQIKNVTSNTLANFWIFFLLAIVNKKKQRKTIGSVIDSRDLKIIILPFFTNKMVFMTTYFIIPLPNMLFVNVFFEQHLQTVLGSPTGFIGVPVFVYQRLSCRLPYEVSLPFYIISVQPEVVNIGFCIEIEQKKSWDLLVAFPNIFLQLDTI